MYDIDFWVGPASQPDRYGLVDALGGGGEGEVWEAVLPLSSAGKGQGKAAVKIVPSRPGDEQEFEQHSRLLLMLSHPGLVRVTETFSGPLMHRKGTADVDSRANYVVMDRVAGITLREWCDENPNASAAARIKILRTVAAALDEMHSGRTTGVPVAHGDVKPSNVIVRDGGGSVLVDLGLTRLIDAGGSSGRSAAYAAPEIRGDEPTPSVEADRYAFAVTTAQVLIGAPVPTGQNGWLDQEELANAMNRSPATRRRPELVRHVIAALSVAPQQRPQNLRLWLDGALESLSTVTTGDELPANEVTAILETAPASKAEKKSRWKVLVAAAAVFLVASLAGGAYLGKRFLPVDQPQLASPNFPGSSKPPPAPSDTESSSSTTSTSDPLAPSAAYLSDAEPVDHNTKSYNVGDWDTKAGDVSGQHFGHAIRLKPWCPSRDGGDVWLDYNISRQWSRFTTTIGLDDDAAAGANATYTVLADTKPVATGQLTLGQSVPLDIPVAGVLRLRLLINTPAASSSPCKGAANWVIWGEPKLEP